MKTKKSNKNILDIRTYPFMEIFAFLAVLVFDFGGFPKHFHLFQKVPKLLNCCYTLAYVNGYIFFM